VAISVDKWRDYFDARNAGHSIAKAAVKAGLDKSSAYRFERRDPSSSGIAAANRLGYHVVAGEVVPQETSEDARLALEDFALFRLRYMGRRSQPWQERAAYDVLRLMETQDREFAVINCPPGSGKSTLFTHDIPAWLIARDRTIRIQLGSRTERQARMYVGRLKRTLERDAPLKQDPDLIAMGLVVDAQACMAEDFTPFQPEGRSDLWRHEALVVRQTSGQALDDKEATVSAWGQDSGFLGGRFDLVVWDDLVDRRNTKTEDANAGLREWYSTEAETRLEPGGLLILQGQRIAANDLYRYALDLRRLDEKPKYHHIIYRAHDDEKCEGDHGKTAKAWPDGCLLDPYRLPWSMLQTVQQNEPRTYNLQYQQRDDIVIGGLVEQAWLDGGVDSQGRLAPGCWDRERGLRPPEGIQAGFMTIDPSPSEFWGIGWWAWDGQRLSLVRCRRTRLASSGFLNMNIDTHEFSGLLHDWWSESLGTNAPIHMVVVEINAAQKYLVTQPHVQKWQTVTGCHINPHITARNKADPDYGVESLERWFFNGLIRLPYGGPEARLNVYPLVDEVKKYPTAATTDMVMMTWFATLATRWLTPKRDTSRYRRAGMSETAPRGLVLTGR
jgi:hypothetical protein